MKRILALTLLAACIAVPATAATRPTITTTPGSSLVYGGSVGYVTSPVTGSGTFIETVCTQDGQVVLDAWGNPIGLGSAAWTGGAASCTGLLRQWRSGRFRTLASTRFTVSAP